MKRRVYNPNNRHNKWKGATPSTDTDKFPKDHIEVVHVDVPPTLDDEVAKALADKDAVIAQITGEPAPTEITRKVGKNRGKSRLWIEGQALIDAGWKPGDRFDVVYHPEDWSGMVYRVGTISYVKNPNGKRKVAGTADRPIIDTNTDDIKDTVGDDHVTVKLKEGAIYIIKKVVSAILLAVSLVASFFTTPAPASEPQVLIACEESGTVRDAFRRRGIQAVSCDLAPTRTDPGSHYQGDVRDVLHAQEWDLLIGHPPCTGTALSGVRWQHAHWVTALDAKPNAEGLWWHPRIDGGKGGWVEARKGSWLWDEQRAAGKRRERDAGLDFFRLLWNAPAKRIALEQPRSIVSTNVVKKSQTIHPWEHGHGVRKETWLYLKNLPIITPTNIVAGRSEEIWRAGPGPDRAKERSKTFDGIAEAFAAQWAPLLRA